MGIWSKIFGTRRRSPLKTELDNLRRKIARTDRRLSDLSSEFWENGGICCPGCGVPGFRELDEKQDRRWARVAGIERKLKCDEVKNGRL